MTFDEFRENELGNKIAYDNGDGKEIIGIVVDVVLTGSTIVNRKKNTSYPAFKVKLYPSDGELKDKPFWTTTFPYKEEL